jgi:hypothetical protein
MRRGPWRSLFALLAGTAFAVGVAGPLQLCPCPMHGADARADALAMDGMQMPAADQHMPATGSHSRGTGDSRHDAHHTCTCPGGCCGSAIMALRTSALHATLAVHVVAVSHITLPQDAADPGPNPQVVLPHPNAPPGPGGQPQDGALVAT